MKITTTAQAQKRLRRWRACAWGDWNKKRSMKQMWDQSGIWDRRWVLLRLMGKKRLPFDALIQPGSCANIRTHAKVRQDVQRYINKTPWKVIRAAFVK